MKDYTNHLDHYAVYWWSHFTKMLKENEWGDKNAARNYLEKYWLPDEEYTNIWQPIQNQLFSNQVNGLPALVFSKKFKVLVIEGDPLFLEDEFLKLQNCIQNIGDKFFVVIENTFGRPPEEPVFKMKYPAEITWPELTSGNYISASILDTHHKEFFVFGESGMWGKYAASDYVMPFSIIGFNPSYALLFKNQYHFLAKKWEEVKDFLSPDYAELIEY